MNAQIVCDHQRLITAVKVGYPGSVADITTFRAMDLCVNAGRYFREGEYLLADSAYPVTPTSVPLYKGDEAKTAENARFNMVAAHVRVANEHAIGIL